MTQILPTVGRVVHYEPSPSDPGFHAGNDTQAAIIANVNPDGTLNLAVFDSQGHPYAKQNVPLVQEGEPSPQRDGYAHWMAYQLGQAAKTEAVEKAAKSRKPKVTEEPAEELVEPSEAEQELADDDI